MTFVSHSRRYLGRGVTPYAIETLLGRLAHPMSIRRRLRERWELVPVRELDIHSTFKLIRGQGVEQAIHYEPM